MFTQSPKISLFVYKMVSYAEASLRKLSVVILLATFLVSVYMFQGETTVYTTAGC